MLTDPLASPTGFPFKVLQIDGSMSDATVFEQRTRVCDLGFLRQGYRKEDGTVGWRCPGEPVKAYVHKGGAPTTPLAASASAMACWQISAWVSADTAANWSNLW
ncbi:MAG: hypothetical protein R3C56_34335 [Pirellulaceae bacterium]